MVLKQDFRWEVCVLPSSNLQYKGWWGCWLDEGKTRYFIFCSTSKTSSMRMYSTVKIFLSWKLFIWQTYFSRFFLGYFGAIGLQSFFTTLTADGHPYLYIVCQCLWRSVEESLSMRSLAHESSFIFCNPFDRYKRTLLCQWIECTTLKFHKNKITIGKFPKLPLHESNSIWFKGCWKG